VPRTADELDVDAAGDRGKRAGSPQIAVDIARQQRLDADRIVLDLQRLDLEALALEKSAPRRHQIKPGIGFRRDQRVAPRMQFLRLGALCRRALRLRRPRHRDGREDHGHRDPRRRPCRALMARPPGARANRSSADALQRPRPDLGIDHLGHIGLRDLAERDQLIVHPVEALDRDRKVRRHDARLDAFVRKRRRGADRRRARRWPPASA